MENRNMRRAKFLLIFVFAFVCLPMSHAGHDKPVTFSQLPTLTQQFIKKNFPHHKIALAKKESELMHHSYDVIFTNGDEMEFRQNGEWKKIKCRSSAVPAAIIPVQIMSYVRSNYPHVKIMEIDKKSTYYEIGLSNKVEIKFNKQFHVIDIDV